MFKNSKKLTVMILALVIVASAAALAFQKLATSKEGLTAVVSIDGVEVLALPLSGQKGTHTIDLSEKLEVDIVLEQTDDKIHFKTSSCPDKICINSGWLSRDMDIAVCMPNRTSVVVMPSDQVNIK